MTRSRPHIEYSMMLRSFADEAISLETKLDFVQSRRRNAEQSRELDEFFIKKLASMHEALGEARGALDELRTKQTALSAMLDKLQGPPLHEAIFLGTEQHADQRLAKVTHQGDRYLTALADEALSADLVPGDTVFLAPSLGAILSKARDRTLLGETASVERRLAEDRLVVRDRDEEVVVTAANELRNGSLRPGDRVLWSRQARLAFAKISSDDSNPQFLSLKETVEPPPPLGGLGSEVERLIALFIAALTSPDLAGRYGLDGYNHSVLLVGPPGCGKTLLARTIAYHVSQAASNRCRFATVAGSELESPYVGETQARIRRLFRDLSDYDGYTILFIDEIEAVGRHRGGLVGHHSDKFLAQWLTSLDGYQQLDRVAVIAATNRVDLVDPAVLERVGGLQLRIGRPSRDGAREIFAIHLPASLPFGGNGGGTGTPEPQSDLIDIAVSRLYDPRADNDVAVLQFRDGTRRTVTARELISGRLIKHICLAARQRAFQREWREGTAGIRPDDMEEAVADALERLSAMLSAANARHHLGDLSEDADVVAVEPILRKVRRNRYLATQRSAAT